MIIIRECGIHSCRSPLGKARGDGQVTIDFFPLHGLSGGCFIGEVPGYFEGWYSGDVSHYLPGCGGVILVDNADRDILHLSAAENGCHEEQAEQGQHETYPEIKSAGSHAAKFATEYVI